MAHKLLLADDSVTIQRVIELTFADEDVEVTAVGDGQLAIDRLDTDPPDIILADVDMPKRDGYEVAAYVKSRPKLAHIPVVLLTGAFEPIDQARATAAGSSDVLAKPFEPQMVINRVKELLGRKRPDGGDVRLATRQALSHGTAAADGRSRSRLAASGRREYQPVSLDDYFDQLDAAFSNLQPGAPPAETLGRDGLAVDLGQPTAEVEPVAGRTACRLRLRRRRAAPWSTRLRGCSADRRIALRPRRPRSPCPAHVRRRHTCRTVAPVAFAPSH